ncbi:hypothetical protein [uncultured Chryseobacterium sp.]|uniref:hypothetical protein n=1 Tax=uncultured Chryseobacterium sp. TaxID=259322 RepID=UPI0025F49EF7|nr:hypothetical protein [uncultured Chryseobacterium sp.]
MKILLIGEYSGFHNLLKKGLISNGHEVTLAAYGDGFKNLPADILWKSSLQYPGKLLDFYQVFKSLQDLKDFDIVQFINPEIFSRKFGFNERAINKLINQNKKSFLISAGDDCVVWDFWKDPLKNNERYTWIQDGLRHELASKDLPWEQKSFIEFQNKLINRIDGVIPIMYEYAQAYRNVDKARKTIGIPINVDEIEFNENILNNNKLVVFHGLNRYGIKGTMYVEKAFEYLKKKYPNDLDLIIGKRLPFNEYLEILNKTNIVIDQTSSYSLGINALISMAKGKVVLGGAEPETDVEFGYDFNPAINILPDPKSIIKEIEKLLDTRSEISKIGQKSRHFVKTYHDHRMIAKQYCDEWSK